MSFSFNQVDVINLFAEEFAKTKAFYETVLHLPLAFADEDTAVFKLKNTMVCLTDASSVPDLISPEGVADPAAGSRFMLAMFVEDLDAACSDLAARGVQLLNGPVDRPWGVRTANFKDPGGHIWQISQDLPS